MNRRFLALAVLVVVALIWWQPLNFGMTEVTIPPGANAQEITDFLRDNGVVRDRKEFLFWLRISGKEKHLRSGTYTLYKYKNPLYVIDRLSYGGYSDITVTITEGLTIRETAAILASQGLVDQRSFIELCEDPAIVKAFGLPGGTLEGYLFPDTYAFSPMQSDSQIIAVFIRNFNKHIEEYGIADTSLQKIMILASLVEKEAKFEDERPIIAKVFLNRIARERPLESCATVLYAFRRVDYEKYHDKKKLSEKDLKIKSLYNTYLYTGLPPGPICSPGKSSLHAALSPADVDYLYFVSMGNGRHHFSRTFQEHVTAKEKYREKN